VVGIFYYVTVDDFKGLRGDDDAADAAFFEVNELLKNSVKLAFDHAKLLQDLLSFLQNQKQMN
jgi:ADP-ribose pyrophosphatase YjhB (NUDIX family)